MRLAFVTSRRRFTRGLLALGLVAACPRLAHAQGDAPTAGSSERARWGVAIADSLLRAGSVKYAEAYYYWASRIAPREPMPRLALGRYLASRGALRVGAVLIEEARQFGASPAVAALYLAPLYTQLGAWAKLAALQSTTLGDGVRERAAWLAARTTSVAGPDTTIVRLQRGGDAGAIALRVGGSGSEPVVAVIDAGAHGVVLDTSWRRAQGVRVFGDVGIVERATFGEIELTNVPISFAPLGAKSAARVGLDFLARFSPTVDGARGRLVLRRDGRVTPPAGDAYVVLLDATAGARVAGEEGLLPVSELLRNEPVPVSWTLDGRAGTLVVHQR